MAKKVSLTPSQIRVQVFQPSASIAHLEAECREVEATYEGQPTIIKRFMEIQGGQLADAMIRNQPQVQFKLPDRVAVPETKHDSITFNTINVPAKYRDQMVGGLYERLTGANIRELIKSRLIELEGSENKGVSVSSMLLRHVIAHHLVYNLLPSGRSVSYIAPDGEEIPSIPEMDESMAESAITASTDAIVEEGSKDKTRGELLVPYVPAARRFYLPQWVAFDDDGHLLAGSINEAEAHLASMQHFVALLHMAVSIAPHFIFDREYQQKRYGMLGQLVNQGRKLAQYEVDNMIRIIKQRAAAQDLNRGLSLSVPYFDDQALEIREHDFVVIPAGRIMFVPAFVVQASREEQVKVAQDTRLSPSTRKYLLAELKCFEDAFFHAPKPQ